MAERKIGWGPREENVLIGKDIERIEGAEKGTGHAKFASDINTPGTLFTRLLTFKGGRAKVTKVDLSAALKIAGVHAAEVFPSAAIGNELKWDGAIIAAVAAETPQLAQDGVRAIKVELEPLDFWTDDSDLAGASAVGRIKARGSNVKGDIDKAFENADVVHEGKYGVEPITHMCLETHGAHCEWDGDQLTVHLSTQNVSSTANQLAGPLGIDAANIRIICNYIGGGFGSKFGVDEWGIVCAKLARTAKRPVRLMLDRSTEFKIAGSRPSGFAEVKIGAKKDGTITAWKSHHWGSNGLSGGVVRLSLFPYVFDIPNLDRKATGIVTNTGPQRAWRAPNHPQLCALSHTAIDDLASKLKMDSYDVFMKNLGKAKKGVVYREEMRIAAGLINWKENYHLHGDSGDGPVKRGLGMALHTWGGGAHPANCMLRIHPDGTVESLQGSQDIGTGTRTIIAITVAETLGLPLKAINVRLGSNEYPFARGSGGSTTVGGVSGPNRRAAQTALSKNYEPNEEVRNTLPDGILDLVGTKYDIEADELSVGKQTVWHGKKKVCTWKQACRLLGQTHLEVTGKGPKADGLTDSQVGGVQMADVSVDTKTGIIRMNKFVAVQDCGLILDEMTAKSQIYGALIMGIAYALSEERITDHQSGRFINADLENYKLPRIGDIGELVVHIHQPASEYDRGVVGLGEPPVISPGAAISNAVANALGVRVPTIPMTPKRVLDALSKA